VHARLRFLDSRFRGNDDTIPCLPAKWVRGNDRMRTK
jgi:hypothetical protein